MATSACAFARGSIRGSRWACSTSRRKAWKRPCADRDASRRGSAAARVGSPDGCGALGASRGVGRLAARVCSSRGLGRSRQARVLARAGRAASPAASILHGGEPRRRTPIGDSALEYDFDWLVIGSGFGGSVSALRLTEKGHSVGVLECGRRFTDAELPSSTRDLRRYFYNPMLGMKGIFRMTTFRDVAVVSGCGVGGGSLGYANTLYVPPKTFFEDLQWAGLEDWERALEPHYEEARRMLGVVENPHEDHADQLLRELGEELGVGASYNKTPVGVFFGEPGKTVADPYFGGEGPDRTGCRLCGRCMVGCPHGAKNTLVKNYLYFAERGGAKVMPERTVIDVRPLGDGSGADGYEVESVRSGAWLRRERQVLRARGVVVAAGALGTNRLLQRCRLSGSLGRISLRLGELVR